MDESRRKKNFYWKISTAFGRAFSGGNIKGYERVYASTSDEKG